MPSQYYKDALKLAQKDFRACTSRGEYPYLPVLDDFLPAERFGQGVDLGTVQIPMEMIVGTRTTGRTNAFAQNFMPLMPEDTEFSVKWKALCQAHLEEGIRDPIKAYEYMHRFYVEEGNKRVSVLKFFGADTVYARVIRLLPEKNGSQECELYYEYVDFYKYSKVSFIEFSKPGSYVQMQRLLGKKPEEHWTDEERSLFFGVYSCFRQAYEAHGGKRLSSTVGDAMLAYMKIYGYQEMKSSTPAGIKASLDKVWEEVTLQQEQPPIAVKLKPEDEKEKTEGLLAKVFKGKPPEMKVAFIHDKTPAASGWTYSHELGREHVERVFRGELETTAYFNAMDAADPLDVIEKAIADGNTTIFTTSPRLLPASLRAAVDHPKVLILNCSLNKSHRYIRTYYARMYEAKFIIGAIAGSLAGNNPVGYIGDYPIFGQVAGINAFAMGVQMVNPRTKVYLEWSSAAGESAPAGVSAAAKRLRERGVRLISSQDQANQDDQGHTSFGLSLINEDGQVNLARPVWRWGVYYESMLRRIRSRSFQSEYAESSKALNYYWGMSAGVVSLDCSEKLPYGTRRLAALLQDGICSGVVEPFCGPMYAQDGTRMAAEFESLQLEQIINMDWLVENIEGSIPAYEQLNDMGKATVGIVGVEPSTPETAAKEAPLSPGKDGL
jgi:basic membrane lipoprotein Med (substrate-binding protein (PBP1-ABC) superfamily)